MGRVFHLKFIFFFSFKNFQLNKFFLKRCRHREERHGCNNSISNHRHRQAVYRWAPFRREAIRQAEPWTRREAVLVLPVRYRPLRTRITGKMDRLKGGRMSRFVKASLFQKFNLMAIVKSKIITKISVQFSIFTRFFSFRTIFRAVFWFSHDFSVFTRFCRVFLFLHGFSIFERFFGFHKS